MRGDSPLLRQWTLLKALSSRPGGATVRELVRALGVSEKTVRRDLETFQRVGFPLQEHMGPHGRKAWWLQPVAAPPGLSFTFDEAIALHLGRRLLEPLAGTVFWDALQRAFKKIRATLGSKALRYVEQFGQVFCQTMVGASDYAKKAELIDQLMQGIEQRRSVLLTYRSPRATEPASYPIYPYGLIYHRGALYIVGWSPDHEEVRHWKVNRIEQAELTQVPFQRPDDFDLRAHLAKSFRVYQGGGQGEVHVKVRFAPAVACYVSESRWHASQKLTPQKDGSLVAEFDLGDTEEIKRWLLGFGRQVEVLKPDRLRGEILDELRALMQLMESSGNPLS